MRRLWSLIALILVIGVVVVVLRRRSPESSQPLVVGDRLFDAVFTRIRNSAVDPLEEGELYRRAAQGLIGELDDPYAYLQFSGQPKPPAADQPLPQGLFLDRRDGRAVVVATVPGSPADQAGLRPGDFLLGIDTTVINGNRLERAADLLAGPEGSRVALRVRRDGSALTPELRRGPLPAVSAVSTSELGGGIARVRLARIGPGVADTLRIAIAQLRRQGVKSLVLDLRGLAQGGSDLTDATRIADLFLDQGRVLMVSRMRRASGSESLTDQAPSEFSEMPLAVLIDGGTAGAAEVVAGALQDHDRAIVLGSESYGRGATRSSYSLGNGTVLTLTTALWLTPNGRIIQRLPDTSSAPSDSGSRPTVKSDGGRVLTAGGGIVPDRVIEDPSGEVVLAEARRILMRANTPEQVFALVLAPH
jgi:carboxyl-terminal processing protease